MPFNKKIALDGIVIGSEVIYGKKDMYQALGKSWQPTFDQKSFDPIAAQAFLDSLGDIGSYTNTTSPTIFCYLRILYKNNHSLPGPDGIPYIAWLLSGGYSAETLYQTDVLLRSGTLPPACELCVHHVRIRLHKPGDHLLCEGTNDHAGNPRSQPA